MKKKTNGTYPLSWQQYVYVARSWTELKTEISVVMATIRVFYLKVSVNDRQINGKHPLSWQEQLYVVWRWTYMKEKLTETIHCHDNNKYMLPEAERNWKRKISVVMTTIRVCCQKVNVNGKKTIAKYPLSWQQ